MTSASPHLDQLVFGYRDGHELLASSTPVSSALVREILPHVDASFEDDSPHYLVGVPLNSIDRYLLARIWPAPEVARPGAVWTHAFLLDHPAMAFEPGGLLGRFERPSFPELERFSRAPGPAAGATTRKVPDRRLATGLAWAVLGAPEDRPVVLWSVLEEAEQAILDLLEALPLPARRRFAFRTRGRARLGDVVYDIQIASRLVGRPPGPEAKVLDLRRQHGLDAPSWTELATDSLTGKDLRRFLDRFGDAGVTKRREVRALIEVWSAVTDPSPDPLQVTSVVVSNFPDRDALSGLKREMFGDAKTNQGVWAVPEATRLEMIVSRPGAFDWAELGVPGRLPRLLRVKPDKAAELAADVVDLKQADRFAEFVLEEFAHAVEPRVLPSLNRYANLLSFVLQRKPQLLEDSATWSHGPVGPALSVLAVSASRVDAQDVVRAVLQAGSDEAWQAITEGRLVPVEDLVRAALSDTSPDVRLAQIEKADPAGLAAWLAEAEVSTSDAIVLAESLSDETLQGRPAGRWQGVGAELHRTFRQGRIEASVALLVIALNETGPDSDQLLRETFAPVHRGLVEKAVSPRGKARLDGVLPGSEKDGRARRLRMALVRRAEASGWTEHEIAYALEGAGERGDRVTELVPKKDPLRRLLEAAVNRAADMLR